MKVMRLTLPSTGILFPPKKPMMVMMPRVTVMRAGMIQMRFGWMSMDMARRFQRE